MKPLLKNTLYFFSGILLSKLIGIANSMLIARILDPYYYGIWSVVILIVSFAPITSLGTGETLIKKVPFYFGKNDLESVRRVENSVLGSVFLAVGFTLLTGFIALIFFRDTIDDNIIIIVRYMIMAVSISYFSTFFYLRFIAYKDFKNTGRLDAVRSALTLIVQVPLAYFYGLSGNALGFLIAEIALLVISSLLNMKMYGRVAINFNIRLMIENIRTGLLITISWLVFALNTTADRIVAISMLGGTATGYYGLGVTITSFIIMMPQALGRVLYPTVSEGYGRSESREKMIGLVLNPTTVLSLVVPVFIGLIVLHMPIVYSQILKKYEPGLVSGQLLVAGVFFASILRNAANFLVAVDEEKKFLLHVLIALTINVAGNIILIKMGLNITGIALSTTISNGYLCVSVWILAFNYLKLDLRSIAMEIAKLLLPFVISIGTIAFYSTLFRDYLKCSSLMTVVYSLIYLATYSTLIALVPTYRNTIAQIVRSRMRGGDNVIREDAVD
jgi:O-antigen/teichoic acid export membrane protein